MQVTLFIVTNSESSQHTAASSILFNYYQNERLQINGFKMKIVIFGMCQKNVAWIILNNPIPEILSYINRHFANCILEGISGCNSE